MVAFESVDVPMGDTNPTDAEEFIDAAPTAEVLSDEPSDMVAFESVNVPTGDTNPTDAESIDAVLAVEALSSAAEASPLSAPGPTGIPGLAATPSATGDMDRPTRGEATDTSDSSAGHRPANTVAPTGTPSAATACVDEWGEGLGVVMGGSQVVEEGGAEPAEGGSAQGRGDASV
ncbi:hypothetical protein GCM10009555_014680 [Acrocarpospora macrocephala]|uniref:Uncharacterized protein n=1 Tax=Acrocarpospora macrocephala TaxID=150177 RepID=A0A5M3WGM0_9ACTN|nr:hypothetical protein Amac_018710 [Acrocarpospora macrocephala]